MAQESLFLKEFEMSLKFLEGNPKEFSTLQLILSVLHSSTSLSRWRNAADMFRGWSENFGFPILYYLSRSKVDIPKSLQKKYPSTTDELKRLKLLYGDAAEDAWETLESPLGLKGIFDQFKRPGTVTGPVIIQRQDGEKLEFMFCGDDIGFLAETVLEMVANYVNNGGDLDDWRESVQELALSVASKLSPADAVLTTEVATTSEKNG